MRIFNRRCNYTRKKLVGNKMVNGSSAFVPSVAGITMASEIVRCFLNE